ncbi:hypothetical protein [uncultured Chryseobacterium sp.]|uniref:hypothetical protein n=1 Tax=uncultured Chryseobacterium sp. TaxID=259322 RepID=UPI0025E80035|nr:hypothetical protein [uncultured Chryseobacterium sp.]
MFLTDKIDEDDFRDIKNRYRDELADLEYKLTIAKSDPALEIEGRLEGALNSLPNIDHRYMNADIADKRAIVGSIYPEKLIFENEYFRTTRINSFVNLIFLIKKELGQKNPGFKI